MSTETTIQQIENMHTSEEFSPQNLSKTHLEEFVIKVKASEVPSNENKIENALAEILWWLKSAEEISLQIITKSHIEEWLENTEVFSPNEIENALASAKVPSWLRSSEEIQGPNI